MKHLQYVFKFSFLQILLKNKKLTLVAIILFLIQQYSCKTIKPIDDIKPGNSGYAWIIATVNFRVNAKIEKNSILHHMAKQTIISNYKKLI